MWQAIIPIAASLISSYFGNKAAKKAGQQSETEKMMEQLLYKGAQGQNEFGKFLIDLSRDPLISSRNFLNAAANGDQETLLQLLGPELKNLSDGARQSLQTMSQLMPRSGASADYLSSIPFQTQMAQGQVMSSARPNAIRDLMSFGTNTASLGGQFLGAGGSGAANLLNYGQNRRRDAFDQGAATGEAWYNMISNVMGGLGMTGNAGSKGGSGTVPNADAFWGGGDWKNYAPGGKNWTGY